MMERNYLKGAGLSVSRVCLGAMTFGGQADDKTSDSMLDMALEAGINFVDTANIYTGGKSEQILGRALKGRRDQVILATKAGMKKSAPAVTDPNEMGLSRRYLFQTVEKSLKALDTDYIDIFYLHKPDYNTPMEETLYALADLIRQGKIRYFGLSNFPAWLAADMDGFCVTHGLPRPVIGEYVCNLLTRGIESELIPCFKAHSMGIAAYNPLAGGLLTGKYTWQETPEGSNRFTLNKVYAGRYWKKENFEAVEALKEIAARQGLSLLELAYAWCCFHPGVDTMILGASSLEQLAQNLETVERLSALPQEVQAQCDQVWKGLSQDRFPYFY